MASIEDLATKSERSSPLGIVGGRQQSSDDVKEALLTTQKTGALAKLQEILSNIGVGGFHWRLMAICGFGWMADNGWTQTIPMIVVSVQREFWVADWEIGFLGSALFLGMAFGSHVWGRWADMMGRKLAFNVTLLIAGLAGLIAAVSASFYMLVGVYLVIGFGVGGNLPVDGAMFAEFTPKVERGKLMVLLSVFWSMGGFLVALIAWVVIPHNSCASTDGCHWRGNMGWRYVIGIFGGINLLSMLTRAGLPETPAFLIQSGDVEGAKEVLRRMARSNKISPDSEVYKSIDELGLTSNESRGSARFNLEETAEETRFGDEAGLASWVNSVKVLFEGRYMKLTTLLLWGIWFFSTYGFTGFNLFLTKLLEAKGIHAGNLYRDAFIYTSVGIPGSLLGSYLVDTRLGRKWTMVIFTAATSVFLLFFYLVNNENQVILVSCFVNVCSMIMFAAYYTYTPEVYKTSVRGRGVGIASGLSRLAGFLAPLVNSGLLAVSDGITLPMMVNFGAMVISTVFMVSLPIQTKGRALD
ncbi:hypothetical protein AAMO2058_000375200 [Amorphochlora amoebiformis]